LRSLNKNITKNESEIREAKGRDGLNSGVRFLKNM